VAVASIGATIGDQPLVIDFGGFVESRVIEAASLADVTIVPLTYQSTADLMPAVETVPTLQPYCRIIAVLINNTDEEHVQGLMAVLGTRFPGNPARVYQPHCVTTSCDWYRTCGSRSGQPRTTLLLSARSPPIGICTAKYRFGLTG
jgi:hypothetical protein